jgi:hypothetical protein
VIRFGVVLTVVLAAMGLLAGGVLANSLLLVYLAIGAAALAAIMLTAGVLIWREEVFGPSSAGQASPAAKQAAGPSPVLTATGVAQPGWSVGSAADHVTMIGVAPAEPVPGPRRGNEPTSGRVLPASREPTAADELRPRPAREPAAQSQGERDANVPAWSFFANPATPSAAGPDLTQVVGAEAGGSHEADQPPKAARTAEAAAPAAGRPPVTGTAAGEDRAAAIPAERDAPAAPAEPEPKVPEPVSASAEHAAPGDAAVAGLEAGDESPAGAAVRDGHAARGPDTEVTVVPGITRYHRGQCILIRFLGPEDLHTMTLQAAETASYVPCKACRPEQVLAED